MMSFILVWERSVWQQGRTQLELTKSRGGAKKTPPFHGLSDSSTIINHKCPAGNYKSITVNHILEKSDESVNCRIFLDSFVGIFVCLVQSCSL